MCEITRPCVLPVPEGSHFPVQNLPFGTFRRRSSNTAPRTGVRIGDNVLDLAHLADAGCFQDQQVHGGCFHQETINGFLAQGRPAWRQVRSRLQELLTDPASMLLDPELRKQAVVPMEDVEMLLPVAVGDYTDFYASREHATNVGAMFRSPENALNPNWLRLPVAYHGRSSSIVVSGTPVRRPVGQTAPPKAQQQPGFAPSAAVDFELEMGYVLGSGTAMGEPISTADAEEHVFGVVLLNDWSARDIQKWEYQPLGPFNSKNWATTISPWVVPLDALEPFRCAAPEQDPPVLPYLQEQKRGSFNVQLEVALTPAGGSTSTVVTCTNLRHLYWTMPQMVAHHTAGGCPLRPGDLLGTGTLSHAAPGGCGCLLEATRNGARPLQLQDGSSRAYLRDGDTVTLRGCCRGDGYTIGFGDCIGQLLPARG